MQNSSPVSSLSYMKIFTRLVRSHRRIMFFVPFIIICAFIVFIPHITSQARTVSSINWSEGWKAWKNGETEAALSWWSRDSFAALLAPRPARLHYWRMRAFEKLGRNQEAAAIRGYLAEKFPFDFYTFLIFPDGGAYLNQHRAEIKVKALFFPCPWKDEVSMASKKTGVHEMTIWAVMRRESKFRKDAVSPSGAIGLMQLMPSTALAEAQDLNMNIEKADIYMPYHNILLGASHLARLEKKFGCEIPRVAAAYNAGAASVVRWNTLASHDWAEWVENIPYAETREFVRSVLENREIYRLAGGALDQMPLAALTADIPAPIGNIASSAGPLTKYK